jgi:actin, other eukaryote
LMSKVYMIGDEYQQKKSTPKDFIYPMKYGVIQDFENMERIWHHTFYNELRVAPEDQPVLLTEDHGNSMENKRKTCEIMFETFGVQQLMLKNSSIFHLLSVGRTSGVVLNLGDSTNQACSIIDGKIEIAVNSYFGGRDVTSFLINLLNNQEDGREDFDTISGREIVQDIKKKKCNINLGKMDEVYQDSCVFYDLPNGQILNISNKLRSLAPEFLFNPKLVEEFRYEYSVSQLIDQVMQKTDSKFHPILKESLTIAGGGSLFPNLDSRIDLELENLFQRKFVIRGSDDRNYTDWIGGSIYLKEGHYKKEEWMMTEEYKEIGSSIIIQKYPFVYVNQPIVPFKTSQFSNQLLKLLKMFKVTDLRFQFSVKSF